MPPVRDYEAEPCYAIPSAVGSGYHSAVAELPAGTVLAIDGPTAVDWDSIAAEVCQALAARQLTAKQIDLRDHFAAWPDILALTASAELPDDPDFAPLSQASLADFLVGVPDIAADSEALTVVFGPGAALVEHDRLWYADLPKRYAEADIAAGRGRNLGQPAGTGPGTTRRLFYIDWPVLDRHRDAILADVDLWLELRTRTSWPGSAAQACARRWLTWPLGRSVPVRPSTPRPGAATGPRRSSASTSPGLAPRTGGISMMTQPGRTAVLESATRGESGLAGEITGPHGDEQGATIDAGTSAVPNEPRILLGSDGSPWLVVTLPGSCQLSASPAERLAAALARLPKTDHPAYAAR